jgi:hypothetical protein
MPRLITQNSYQNIDYFLLEIDGALVMDPDTGEPLQIQPVAVTPSDPESPVIMDYELGSDFSHGSHTMRIGVVRLAVDRWTQEIVKQEVWSDPFEVVREPIPDEPAKPIPEIVFG